MNWVLISQKTTFLIVTAVNTSNLTRQSVSAMNTSSVGFEIFTAVIMKNAVFWDVMGDFSKN
jgi:hypothetical protein